MGPVAEAVLCAVILLGGTGAPAGAEGSPSQIERGKAVYERFCSGCHGEAGDGETFKAWALGVEPRDLTQGTYKFRSTPQGSLPTDDDLHRTISLGVLRSAMPQFRRLTEPELEAVVQYVKTFSDRWQREGPGEALQVPDPPEFLLSRRSVRRGKAVYDVMECASCHGEKGRGDGPMAGSLSPDLWGERQRSCDLTRGVYKSGDTAQDLYRAIVTGLDGTAMHGFGGLFREGEGKRLAPDDAWHLVSYILALRPGTGPRD